MDYTMTCGDLSVTVSSLGGTVTRLSYRGKDIIYPVRILDGKPRGGIPILFPFFGAPPKQFGDMQKHGWLRHQKLAAVEAASRRVAFMGTYDGTLTSYPWHLRYLVVVSVGPRSLHLTLSVKRPADGVSGDTPINPGFHPYFTGDPRVVIGEKTFTDFVIGSTIVPVQRRVLLELGHARAEMHLGHDFTDESVFVLWSDCDRNSKEYYFCVEPVCGRLEDFGKPGSGTWLKAGEMQTFSCAIKILDVK